MERIKRRPKHETQRRKAVKIELKHNEYQIWVSQRVHVNNTLRRLCAVVACIFTPTVYCGFHWKSYITPPRILNKKSEDEQTDWTAENSNIHIFMSIFYGYFALHPLHFTAYNLRFHLLFELSIAALFLSLSLCPHTRRPLSVLRFVFHFNWICLWKEANFADNNSNAIQDSPIEN